MKEPIILSFDLGKTGAWWVSNYEYGEELRMDSLEDLEKHVKNLVGLYKPDVIIYPHPVRHYNVMRKHWQYIGIINLVAEKKFIQTIEVKDSSAKKVVMLNGKATKEDIMSKYSEKSEHIADCRMFTDWYLSFL